MMFEKSRFEASVFGLFGVEIGGSGGRKWVVSVVRGVCKIRTFTQNRFYRYF